MTLPTFLEPTHARITIPVALAVGYACYHWWRWRRLHPKIVIEDLPEPAPTAESVCTGEAPAVSAPTEKDGGVPARAAENPPVRKPTKDDAGTVPQSGRPQEPSHRQARQESAQVGDWRRFGAYDADSHKRAYRKARAGRPEYFVRLGEYAWRRGAMVEAHFWVSMAKFHGVKGLDDWLANIRARWIRHGRPAEASNCYEQYPFERGVLAHAYLMWSCGFSTAFSRARIAEMACNGHWDVKLILEHVDGKSRKGGGGEKGEKVTADQRPV